jgi:hypothetical protein
MPGLKEILDEIKDEALDAAKTELKDLLASAKDDAHDFVKDNAKKIEKWLVMLANKELEKPEFDALMRARKRIVKQHLNTLEIEARTKLKKITTGLANLVVRKIVPAVLGA